MKKLALIGCGGIGSYHLKHFVQFQDIQIAGLCDLLIERAEGFAREAGSGKAYSDFVRMYDEVQPDMVFICVPPTCHGVIEMETIRRGIPFFVEKPLALDLDLGRELVARVKAAGLTAASGFQCRYDNINEPAAGFIRQNPVVHVAASRVGGIPGVPWWRVKAASGGQLVEQTIHQMDMLRYLLQEEPDTVYSVPTRGFVTEEECPGYCSDDLSTTLITFRSGLTATMMTGCYSTNGASWDSKMTFGSRASRLDYVLCSRATTYGVAGVDAAAPVAGTVSGDGTQRKSEREQGVTVLSSVNFGLICDRTFVDAVLTGDASRIRSPYEDAFKSVAFTLACNQSMASGQPVKVAY